MRNKPIKTILTSLIISAMLFSGCGAKDASLLNYITKNAAGTVSASALTTQYCSLISGIIWYDAAEIKNDETDENITASIEIYKNYSYGEPTYITITEYNINGNELRHTEYSQGGKISWLGEYDGKYNSDGDIEFREVTTYDNESRPIGFEHRNADGSIPHSYLYEYINIPAYALKILSMT